MTCGTFDPAARDLCAPRPARRSICGPRRSVASYDRQRGAFLQPIVSKPDIEIIWELEQEITQAIDLVYFICAKASRIESHGAAQAVTRHRHARDVERVPGVGNLELLHGRYLRSRPPLRATASARPAKRRKALTIARAS